MSLHAHEDYQHYPRDDLESLCYTISVMTLQKNLLWSQLNYHPGEILAKKRATPSQVRQDTEY